MAVRVRYAPSPTGAPHVGNLRTAVFDWLAARKYGGEFIARLEDTDRDPARYRPEHIGEIEESLDWLGITPDEWWVSGGPSGPYVQSERLHLYREAADRLIGMRMAYKCFCTEERLAEMRRAQQRSGAPTGYDRRCRGLSDEDVARAEADGLPHTVRLAVPLEGRTEYTDLVYGRVTCENRHVDDQVLLKSNGWPTYHLAVVVDDHHMRITHAIRGEDWMPSTPKHVMIYEALGWEQPVWVHIPLTLGTDRKKLSKRHGSTQFTDFMRGGYLPEAMFNFMVLLGWSAGEENRELMSVDEIVERFTLEGISKTPAVFDYDKLRWMNGEHIRRCDLSRLADLCKPYIPGADAADREYLITVLSLVRERMRLLTEASDLVGFFLRDPEAPAPEGQRKWLTGPEAARRLSLTASAVADAPDPWNSQAAEASINRVAEEMATPRAPVIHTTRVAVSGQTVGPGIFQMLEVMGRERVLRRLRRALEWVSD